MPKRLSTMLALILALFILRTGVAMAAEYLVQPGDVLEFDAAGATGLRQRLPVSEAGTIRVPLIGAVSVGGKTLDQITHDIETKLGSRSIRQSMPGGREARLFFEPGEIFISIAEYRPVFVTGDVQRSGQQTYRPGMTTGQAISQAGGLGILGGQAQAPFMQALDLRAELAGLWIEMAGAKLQTSRIQAELSGNPQTPDLKLENVPVPAQLVDSLVAVEKQQFDIAHQAHQKELAYFEQTIKQNTTQLQTLQAQLEKEKEGMEDDTRDLSRLSELQKRGNTNGGRVADARRSALLSSTRFLQTTVQHAQLQRDNLDFRRRIEKLNETRKAALLKLLQETTARAGAIALRIDATTRKLGYVNGIKSPNASVAAQRPILSLARVEKSGKVVRTVVDEDSEMLPGDVLDVSIRTAAGATDTRLVTD